MNEKLPVSTDREAIQPAEHSSPEPLLEGESNAVQAGTAEKVDDALVGVEKVDLGIDWSSLDLQGLKAGMAKYDSAESTLPGIEGKRSHTSYVLHESDINTASGEKLKLKLVKVISPNFHEVQIEITRPSIPESETNYYVSDFDFLQLKDDESEEWDMKHRHTSTAYRQQGIAGKVLGTMEHLFKNRGENNGLSQSVSAKSGQKHLTDWLVNRSYSPATQEDADKYERLNNPDDDLKEVTFEDKTYVFDLKDFKEKYGDQVSGPEDPAVWNPHTSYEKPFYYMRSSFKIKMKKEL